MSTPPAKRPPVIIIGAHRSGTTATARALALLGLQLGQRLDSHHESKAMQRLHDHYLERVGAAWHRPGPFLESIGTARGQDNCTEYLRERVRDQFASLFGYGNNPMGWWLRARLQRGCTWGWKEPRTTLFAPGWLQVFPEARFLEVVRHPLAVASSIRQRELKFRADGDPPHPGLDQLNYCVELALTYVAAGEALAARTPNYRRIHFETLQADPPTVLTYLAEFCLLQPNDAQLKRAARTIRPPSRPAGAPLSSQEEEQLRAHDEVMARLGYEWPARSAP